MPTSSWVDEGQSRFDVIYGTVSNGNTSATAGVQRDDSTFVRTLRRLGCSCYWRAKLYPAALWNAFSNADSYSDGDSNRHSDGDGNRYSDGDSYGHTHRNSNSYVHAISYSYAKTHSNAEAPHHTKATSDSTASSVTGNTRLENLIRNAGIEERDFRGRR